jgi:hypothetical protein
VTEKQFDELGSVVARTDLIGALVTHIGCSTNGDTRALLEARSGSQTRVFVALLLSFQ